MDRGLKEIVKTCLRIEAELCLGPDAIRPSVFSVFEGPVYWQAVRFFSGASEAP